MTQCTSTLEFIYDESGNPLMMIYAGTPYYYVTNQMGDVVKLVNSSGTSVAEYTYNAWGEHISSGGGMSSINPLRYRGYYFDEETGLYYLNSRYYDSKTCRFINADGLTDTGNGILGNNMYAYCINNPVCMIDFGGNKPEYSLSGDAVEEQKMQAEAKNIMRKRKIEKASSHRMNKTDDLIRGSLEVHIQLPMETQEHLGQTEILRMIGIIMTMEYQANIPMTRKEGTIMIGTGQRINLGEIHI